MMRSGRCRSRGAVGSLSGGGGGGELLAGHGCELLGTHARSPCLCPPVPAGTTPGGAWNLAVGPRPSRDRPVRVGRRRPRGGRVRPPLRLAGRGAGLWSQRRPSGALAATVPIKTHAMREVVIDPVAGVARAAAGGSSGRRSLTPRPYAAWRRWRAPRPMSACRLHPRRRMSWLGRACRLTRGLRWLVFCEG